MFVATTTFRCRYGGEEITVSAGERLANDHPLAATHRDKLRHVPDADGNGERATTLGQVVDRAYLPGGQLTPTRAPSVQAPTTRSSPAPAGTLASTALHEAGHAVAAVMLGCRVRSVELFSDGGGVTWLENTEHLTDREALRVVLAGRAAAAMLDGPLEDESWRL